MNQNALWNSEIYIILVLQRPWGSYTLFIIQTTTVTSISHLIMKHLPLSVDQFLNDLKQVHYKGYMKWFIAYVSKTIPQKSQNKIKDKNKVGRI